MDGRSMRAARVLVVDDEPFNVDYLEQELTDRGHQVEAAFNGREALDRVAASPPDLILLDVVMPEMDGITVCRILKDDPETRLIPIIIMTALSGQEDRIRGIAAGADDFLTKPVDERELHARIDSALRLKRAVDRKVGELESATEQLAEMSHAREAAVVACRVDGDHAAAAVLRTFADHGGHAELGSDGSVVGIIEDEEPQRAALVALQFAADAPGAAAVAACRIPLHQTADSGARRELLCSIYG